MAITLGIDIGATGIKGALIDTNTGALVSDRKRYKTPSPATPKKVIDTVHQLIKDFDWESKPLGVGFPAIVLNGIAKSATNIDKGWVDYPIQAEMIKKYGSSVVVLNDADAAGIAEYAFGKAKDVTGVALLLTLGTGIGSALFSNGQLVMNTELGMLKMHDGIAEHYASNSAREKKDLSWKQWGAYLSEYIQHVEVLFSPSRIILSGGVSKKFDKYSKYLKPKSAEIVPATLLNNAGIIGAAMAVHMGK